MSSQNYYLSTSRSLRNSPSRADRLKAAQADGTFWNLSPSKTTVELRPLVRPEIPEVYTDKNAGWYKNRIVAADRNEADMYAAHRVFLDCFAGACGFIPNHVHLTKAQSKKYNKWGAVVGNLKDIPDLKKKDMVILSGCLLRGISSIRSTTK